MQPFSDQCFLLPTAGQSLLFFSLPPTPAHLLLLGLLPPPLAVGSLCCHAPTNLSAVTTRAARTAARPATLKTRTMKTDGSKRCMKQTLSCGCALSRLGAEPLVNTSVPNPLAISIHLAYLEYRGRYRSVGDVHNLILLSRISSQPHLLVDPDFSANSAAVKRGLVCTRTSSSRSLAVRDTFSSRPRT